MQATSMPATRAKQAREGEEHLMIAPQSLMDCVRAGADLVLIIPRSSPQRCPARAPRRFSRSVLSRAGAAFRGAQARLGQLAVRPDAGLGVHAPEQAVVRRLHPRVRFRGNELPLPAQRRTQIRIVRIEALAIADHAAPPAFPMARFTATRASCTL